MKKIVGLLALILVQGCSEDTAQSDAGYTQTPQAAAEVDERPAVLFLGTSLTAGLGVGDDRAYPALIQEKADAAGYGFRVVNAGNSGDTSAGGLRRLDWLLRQPVAVLVIELGANDGLRGLDIETLRANLLEVIDRSRAAHPDITVLLAAMEAPPNMGDRYTEEFRRVFPEVAE
jgi:acyl-CoA thioesterase-1